jgi:hypothetical protein
MARVFTFARFLGHSTPPAIRAGGATIPAASWRGFAIGPGSEVHQCVVNGSPLGVGGVLPMNVNGSVVLTAVVGRPTDEDFGGLLEIVAFECGDAVAPIGLRAPRVESDQRDMNGTAAYARILRVPYAGRRAAKIHFFNATVGTAFDYVIKGVSYLPRPHDTLVTGPLHSVDLVTGNAGCDGLCRRH